MRITIRNCASRALEYMGHPHGKERDPAIWAAIHDFERDGVQFRYQKVKVALWYLEHPKPKKAAPTIPSITLTSLTRYDNGLVGVYHDGHLFSVVTEEEARDTYPVLDF